MYIQYSIALINNVGVTQNCSLVANQWNNFNIFEFQSQSERLGDEIIFKEQKALITSLEAIANQQQYILSIVTH